MKAYEHSGHRIWSKIKELYDILTNLNRCAEMKRLVIWASRKRLKNPLRLYQNMLEHEEIRLFHYAVTAPRLTNIAYLIYQMITLISRPPRYFPRGSAALYRTKRLTQTAYQS